MRHGKEEKELISAAKGGNLDDFEKILFAYEKEIFAYVYRLVREKPDAEDLTQDIFIKLYRHIGSINPEKGIRAWLYRVATNTVYDFWRRKRRQPESFTFDNLEQLETIEARAAYTFVESNETARDVAVALDQIAPIHRSVLLLYYDQGFAYDEIAEILGQPMNTVKTHLRRAKEAMRKKLNNIS